MRSEIDDVLTTGMNSPGDTSPRTGWRHRIEGFRADQIAAAEIDLWLVEQFEFFALGGERKLGLKRQPGFDLLPNPGFEQHAAAAPAGLGTAKRKVSVGQQLVCMGAAGGENRGADRNPDAVRTAARHHRSIKTGRDPFSQLVDAFRHVVTGCRDRKFVAAESGDDAGVADLTGQAIGYRA